MVNALQWSDIGVMAGIITAAVIVGLLVHLALFSLLPKLVDRPDRSLDDELIDRLRKPTLLLMLALVVLLAVRELSDLPRLIPHLVALAAYVGAIWLIITIIGWVERLIKGRHDVSVADNLEARRVHTQISVIARSLMVVVLIVGIGAALMTFDRVRMLGTAVLASAGIAGLIIGLAARPVLENLFAGLQIALTQPIRIDDVVIIDGEWGRIEEITLTYVVVRIWDKRRLIVPFSKIISDSFQNWTRRTADILGTIFLHTDYTVPVERVREELKRICESTDMWDGNVCVLQVTEARERTMELRALVSAKDSPTAWDLRVYVREKLIDFLQREYPEALPRMRIEMHDSSEHAD